MICSSSFEGDYYKGAPGSTLIVDDFSILQNK
ncbi:PCMD domain-containing protein [Bacteroides fragilis]